MAIRKVDPTTPIEGEAYYFDEEAARKVVDYFPRYLVHTKTKYKDKPFELLDWQINDIIRPVFGWKREDGTRRFRVVFVFVPKKNGKSALSSGLGIYLAFADGEPGAEVYCCAADRKQAGVVFDDAKYMAEHSKVLGKILRPYRNHIVRKGTNSKFEVLSSDADTKHGFNVHGLIADEFHSWDSDELYHVLAAGVAARDNPLVVVITTAGNDTDSPCHEMYERALKVIENPALDPEMYVYIAEASESDDWTSEDTWKSANPSYGITVNPSFLKAECRRAQMSPALEASFKQLHLNLWQKDETRRFLPLHRWTACDEPVSYEALKGRECFAGIDLSETYDMSALALLFPPRTPDEKYEILVRYWLPSGSIEDNTKKDKKPYQRWIDDGWLVTTPGDVVNYEFIRSEIIALSKDFKIKEVGYDKYKARQLVEQLKGDGFKMIEINQSWNLTSPLNRLLTLAVEKNLRHGNHPILEWNVDCLAVEMDAFGNLRPSKRKSAGHIDGVSAILNALDRAERQGKPKKSYFSNR